MFKIFIKHGNVVESNLNRKGELNFFKAGEIFEPEKFDDIENLYFLLKQNRSFLKELIGEFSVLIEDKDNIFVLNDETGVIKWYYYYTDEVFLLSNNFWEIVNYIKPSVEDIEIEAIYEDLLLSKTFNSKTFIKGIKVLEAGSLLTFNKIDSKINIDKYKDIVYLDPKSNINKKDLFDNIDNLFSKMLEKIRKFNNNPKIGVTISGGLDSRFPLPFLKKEEVSSTYLIGQKNNLLTPFDYDNAKKLANLYKFRFKMINPFSVDFNEKIKIDLIRNPSVSSNIMKALDYNKTFKEDNIDVIITGAYGGLIGGRVLTNKLLEANDEELIYALFFSYSYFSRLNSFRNSSNSTNLFAKIYKAISYIFGTNLKRNDDKDRKVDIEDYLSNDFLFDNKFKQNIFYKIQQYVNKEKQKSKNNLSIIMKYHLSIHSIRGAFESLHGQIKSYSIYNPYIYQYSKTWPADFLKDRFIMEEYLFHKYPKLAEIPLQSYGLSIKDKYNSMGSFMSTLIKGKNLFMFFSKRLAINYNTWWNRKEVKDYVYETFNNEYSYFYKIFKKNDVEKIISNKNYYQFAEDLFKTKLLVDTIESKNYKTLLNNDIFKYSSKY